MLAVVFIIVDLRLQGVVGLLAEILEPGATGDRMKKIRAQVAQKCAALELCMGRCFAYELPF